MTDDAQTRLQDVLQRIRKAEVAANREPETAKLVAVSKTFDADYIRPVLSAGQRIFGENKVQESQGKWPGLKKEFSDVELHLIGPLQTNKARDAVALFDCIQTVDRPKLAKTLAAEMERQSKFPELLIQVNTGEEPQKAGIKPAETAEFLTVCRNEYGLNPVGLMCIPPFDEEPSLHFALLRKMADQCGLEKISMGMSSDFETAIEFGATHVRVGSAIFGARSYPTG